MKINNIKQLMCSAQINDLIKQIVKYLLFSRHYAKEERAVWKAILNVEFNAVYWKGDCSAYAYYLGKFKW